MTESSRRPTRDSDHIGRIVSTCRSLDAAGDRLVLLTESLTGAVPAGSRLGDTNRHATGYIDYVRQATLRAGLLAQAVANDLEHKYAPLTGEELPWLVHQVEAPLTLARTVLELVGRVRTMTAPHALGDRLRAYAGLAYYDYSQVARATMSRPVILDELEASAANYDRLAGNYRSPSPGTYRRAVENENVTRLMQWHLPPSAAIENLLTPSESAKGLYQVLSAAVHGGVLIEPELFRRNTQGLTYGYALLMKVSAILLTEIEGLYEVLYRAKSVGLAPRAVADSQNTRDAMTRVHQS